MEPYYQDASTELYLGDCFDVLPLVGEVDHVITDTPYSDRTHNGMRIGTVLGNNNTIPIARDGPVYESWTPEQATAAALAMADKCLKWIVSFTDHCLWPHWDRGLSAAGMYTFPPLPFVEVGKQPRLSGDGPASWTCWLMVARQKNREAYNGSLPGAYIQRSAEKRLIKGGKPEWVVQAIIRDYTEPGDTILDICAGSGTTLAMAKYLGRKAIGIEIDESRCEMSAKRCEGIRTQEVLDL